jgi:prevent-host-death family protein
MQRVGVCNARMHLSKLVGRASRGETIVITRNGHPMAMLTSAANSGASLLSCDEAMAALRDIRSRSRSDETVTIRKMIEEGRRD